MSGTHIVQHTTGRKLAYSLRSLSPGRRAVMARQAVSGEIALSGLTKEQASALFHVSLRRINDLVPPAFGPTDAAVEKLIAADPNRAWRIFDKLNAPTKTAAE